MLELDPVPKVITFDCYGTLVRWHETVRTAVRAILAEHMAEADAREQSPGLADRLRAAAVERQQSAIYQDYKSVLRSALAAVLADLGRKAEVRDDETLLAILARIEPHPEVPTALATLRKSYRLAIISNTDDDLIAGTVEALGVPVDYVITAQQARAYKPDHTLFLHAYATMGVDKAETIHVGMGQFTDLKVCSELGVRSVWIDRISEPLNPAWRPSAVLQELSALPALLSPNRNGGDATGAST